MTTLERFARTYLAPRRIPGLAHLVVGGLVRRTLDRWPALAGVVAHSFLFVSKNARGPAGAGT